MSLQADGTVASEEDHIQYGARSRDVRQGPIG